MSKNWKQELEDNRGKIIAPDGKWVEPRTPLTRIWDGDVWSDPEFELRKPDYERGLALFDRSLVACGFVQPSGMARFGHVFEHGTDRATGDLFDYDQIYIDRHAPLPGRLGDKEYSICDEFGIAPMRAMNRLVECLDKERTTLLRESSINRMMWLCLWRKVWLARAGYPEYCERQIF